MKIGDVYYEKHTIIEISHRTNTVSETQVERVNAIEVPENATNGDMIMTLFPKAKFDNAFPFTDDRWETMLLNPETSVKDAHLDKPTQLRTYADWWNAPYKSKKEESI